LRPYICSDCSIFLISAIRRSQIPGDQGEQGRMINQSGKHESTTNVLRLVAGAGFLLSVVSALAQDAKPEGEVASSSAAPAATPAPPAPQSGLIDAFGRWLEEGAASFRSGVKDAQDKFDKFSKEARDATKEATGTVLGLPNSRVLAVRERCAVASNGAPDCQTAALALCRGKGFTSGKSIDTRAEQKCPPRLLLQGKPPNDADCATETYITRAMCQ
jgi:hypothetical protein